jgi:UDP-glucose 4-epimerase
VVAKFFKQACSSASMIVNGDGSQTRDFVYIDDVVQAMAKAAFAENVKHEIVNVGSGEATSMKTLAEQIHALTRSESDILYTPRNDGGVSYMCADLAHAQKVLNWEPEISLEEGLKLVLENDDRFEINEK